MEFDRMKKVEFGEAFKVGDILETDFKLGRPLSEQQAKKVLADSFESWFMSFHFKSGYTPTRFCERVNQMEGFDLSKSVFEDE